MSAADGSAADSLQRYRAWGSIGCIIPPRCNETQFEEAYRIRPPGLTWCFASLGMPDINRGAISDALTRVEAAVEELAVRRVSAIVYCGVVLTSAQGPTYYASLRDRVARIAGRALPIETDSTILRYALTALGAHRVTLVAPYEEGVVSNVAAQVAGMGFDVACARGLGLTLPEFITEPTTESAYDLALSALREAPESEALILSCPQWPVVGNIARIEAATGKPVVTQVQSILWWAINVLRLPLHVAGYGRLLEEMPAVPQA